ncbi:hypothetical protein BGX21_007053 [Mortierella sp. AD011]|nr:hypothetical protein BGX20_010569 [Mortierella sp. AD010]KAF9398937.1 hypothetical protein BGX21_007053 [Mortierella sp. AD011]
MDKDGDKDSYKGKAVTEDCENINQSADTVPHGPSAQMESEKQQKATDATVKSNPVTRNAMPGPDPVETSSSSEGEDIALLEEVIRIKAQLEAKLRAKQLRRMAKSKSADTFQEQAPDAIKSHMAPINNDLEDKCDLTLTPKRAISQPQLSCTPKRESPPGTGEDDNRSISDITTPTKRPSPLVSPGFRTPSPPPRTRFLMSPPSGASSRKRQHSPSPLPRGPSLSLSQQRARNDSSTPTSARRLRAMDEPTSTPVKRLLAPTVKGAVDLFQDLFDEDLDDVFLDTILDNEELEQSAPDTSDPNEDRGISNTSSRVLRSAAGGGAATNPTLTEVVEAQKQKREAEKARQQLPKATFHTVAASRRKLSAAESTKLRHTQGHDSITGLMITNRITSCEDMASMTHGLKIIPIKDSDGIRENSIQRSSSGVLTGRLSITSKKIADDSESENWLVAGVVGAKSKERMTAKKVKYCHFQLCDLQSSLINVFMFREVMARHYEKIRTGDVIAIMNPKVLHQAERSGALGVEVEHPDCLLVIGTSADFGMCEAVKLNGEKCGRLLDKRASAYCNYHIMMAANKRRNQRGSLIAGTSSIYDLDKPPQQAGAPAMPRKLGGAPQSSHSSEKLRMMTRESKETTYIFDDGGVGTSALMDHKNPRKGPQQPEDSLSAFLMNQNNPGGQYLRQAKASKDVAWAKDVTSPKTPTNNSELFPSEMIRRMGYDPVSGQFVPGSPKRMNDDLQARERSIRLLTERVRSPPAPMRPLTDLLPLDRKRTIDVKGTTRPIAQPRSSKLTSSLARGGKEVQGDVFFGDQRSQSSVAASITSPKKWINLDDGSSASDSDSESSILSLSKQREKNLLESRAAQSRTSAANNNSLKSTVSSVAQSTALLTTKRKLTVSSLTGKTSLITPQKSQAASSVPKGEPTEGSGADTQIPAPSPSSIPSSNNQAAKKQRFIDFSDSE